MKRKNRATKTATMPQVNTKKTMFLGLLRLMKDRAAAANAMMKPEHTVPDAKGVPVNSLPKTLRRYDVPNTKIVGAREYANPAENACHLPLVAKLKLLRKAATHPQIKEANVAIRIRLIDVKTSWGNPSFQGRMNGGLKSGGYQSDT